VIRKELARLELAGPEKIGAEDYGKKTAELRKKREALEIELMSGNRDFMLQKKSQDARADVLTAFMPRNAVYLDYAKIRLFDFREKKWLGPHYLVFLFSPGTAKPTQLLDMGPADQIDRHINEYLREMARAGSEGKLPDEKIVRQEAAALYNILVRPIENVFQGKDHILISPDGNPNLIPFEALVDPTGKYFIEKAVISYVGAGRDIVKFSRISLKGGTSLIIADPDYDLGQNEIERVKKNAGPPASQTRSFTVRDLEGMHFDRLPDTKKEADVIEKILHDTFSQTVLNRQDKKALEYTLFESFSPKVLHLATHGYFLTKQESKMIDATPDMAAEDDLLGNPSIVIENPMLRSGIVLAGANTSLKTGQDEGMITAEKVLGLRLKGTDLVVLSACRTGVGDVESGEGVFGLKRAFILSGAKSIIMSLWSVPSQETVDLMSSFYTQISEGKTPSVALRQAKLSIMQKQPHPFFWAAFILTGTP
jgi:CHAT domain-containing protein